MNPLIITAAIIGAEITKETYPYIPNTPSELAQAAIDAVNAGASIIHLHVRDNHGRPSQDISIFDEVSQKIKEKCDCIIQFSTGGAAGTATSERIAPLALRPEMATLSMGSLNFGDQIFENTESIITEILLEEIKYGVMPELEIFDLGMMDTVDRYMKKNLLPKKFHIDFVLGVPGGMMGSVKNLQILLDRIHSNQSWTVAGIGRWQLPLSVFAISQGGHVRVGLEDNIYYRKGEVAKSNAQFVERIKKLSLDLDRPVASPKEAREILCLNA